MFAEGDLAAPTVKTLSLFSMLAMAGAKNMHMMTFDIGQAFLNADIENEVYVRLDEKTADILTGIRPEYAKYKTTKSELILKLLKAFYGTREAAKLWYDHFKGILESYGYMAIRSLNWINAFSTSMIKMDLKSLLYCFMLMMGL